MAQVEIGSSDKRLHDSLLFEDVGGLRQLSPAGMAIAAAIVAAMFGAIIWKLR
jgi:hypothetical protein